MGRPLFTIGHSSHPGERFVELLRMHEVTAVCDVRSVPYSRRNPQFNRETLRNSLGRVGISYVPLAEELGARRSEEGCYDDEGRVVFERVAEVPAFAAGLERVRRGVETHSVALMCAEGEPLACHRTILVCRALRGALAIAHILRDGALEPHEDAERRLVRLAGLDQGELFAADDAVERAYAWQARRIAYVR